MTADLPFRFDLQLFAEPEPGEAGGAPQGGQDPSQGAETPAGEGGAPGTILGGAGQPQGDNSQGGQQTSQASSAPDTYDFSGLTLPEGMEYDEKSAQEFGAVARQCGLSQEQASQLATYGMQYMQQGVAAVLQQQQAQYAKWGEDAKAQLGADFEKTVSKAAVGIDRLSQQFPGLRQMFNETGVGNRIEMIRLMAQVGELVGEDTGHGVPGYGGQKSLYPNTNFGQYK